MKIEVKNFGDIDRCLDEIEYYIMHGDIDKMYSNRGLILEQSRALMVPCYIHLWMIMYPIEGQEYTRANNITDLAGWLLQISNKCKDRLPLQDIYTELSDKYLMRVRSELEKHHGYPNLKGKLGQEISLRMSDIFSAVQFNIVSGRKKDKHYQITLSTIEDLIKFVLDIN